MDGEIIEFIRENVATFGLDLSGLVVFTEAATGSYAVTPVIAAIANAQVIAIAKDSKYGSAEDAENAVRALAEEAGVEGIEFVRDKSRIGEADIVTNSGAVRPISREDISRMKETSVIPLMWETWEFREADMDLRECWKKGVAVLGTDESVPEINLLSYTGAVCLALFEDAGIHPSGKNVVVLGNTVFTERIAGALREAGATVKVFKEKSPIDLTSVDVVVVSEHFDRGTVVGKDGWIKASEVPKGAHVIQFFGEINRDELDAAGILYTPKKSPGYGHMGKTMADLGPKPLVLLNTGSLKVGEAAARARLSGKSMAEAEKTALQESPAQGFGEEQKRRYGYGKQ
ncbi:hypothetical protein ACFLQ2_04620 [archaeon]